MKVQGAEELVRTPLLTHEVGSLDKPSWRVKGFAGKPLHFGKDSIAYDWVLHVPGNRRGGGARVPAGDRVTLTVYIPTPGPPAPEHASIHGASVRPRRPRG